MTVHVKSKSEAKPQKAEAADVARRVSTHSTGPAEECETDTVGQAFARKIVNFPCFDSFMAGVILFNMLVMIVETDHFADETAPGGTHWTEVVGWVILCTFVTELILKLYVERLPFFKCPWNCMDTLVIVIDIFFSLLALVAGNLFPVSILRILRLAKLARVSKFLRAFGQIRTMIEGLSGSVSAIFWGTVLIFFVVLVWAIIAVQFIHPLNKEMDYGDCERCPRAFETVMASALTIFQHYVLGDSPGSIALPLMESHASTVPFFIMLFLSVGLGALNMILGVVCNVFAEARDRIVAEIEQEKLIEIQESKQHLLQACVDMDVDESGELTKDELFAGYQNVAKFRDALTAMGISVKDIEMVWTILDSDGSGSISYHEFAGQLYAMQSSSNEVMMAYIRYYLTTIRNAILEQMERNHVASNAAQDKMQTELTVVESVLEDGVHKVEEDVAAMLTQAKEAAVPIGSNDTGDSIAATGTNAVVELKNGSPDSKGRANPQEWWEDKCRLMHEESMQLHVAIKDCVHDLHVMLAETGSLSFSRPSDSLSFGRMAPPQPLLMTVPDKTYSSCCGIPRQPEPSPREVKSMSTNEQPRTGQPHQNRGQPEGSWGTSDR